MPAFLSKSDFKIAQSCAAKLFFKKNGFPSAAEENEYLLMLADGGFMVGKMAQLLYDDGIEIFTDEGTEKAIQETEELLLKDRVTLFEAAIQINSKLIRIDILQKEGNTFKLIEVKSKSFDSVEYQTLRQQGKKYFELSEWREYIEDVAFQKYVLQEKYPQAKIEAYLLMPDKSKTTPIEGLIDWFKLENTEIVGKTKFRKTDVSFSGNIQDLKKGHILELANVDEYADKLLAQIKANSEIYIGSILTNEKIEVQIETNCSKCEYTVTNNEFPTSGFKHCWGGLADVSSHIFELAQLGNFNRSKDKHIDNLIKQKKVRLHDIPIEIIQDKYNNRPFYQVTKNDEFLLPGIREVTDAIEYPLHFIDFETSQMAIPYHAGMRPYGKVIFQWSCHVIEKEGADPKHYEWLNTTDKFPNFEFAKSLKSVLGDNGSIMIWSSYENTMLKDISRSLEQMNHVDQDLKNWLERTIKNSKDEPSRIIDMNHLALKYYFHPMMGGRTSIKVTLPAVLNSCKLPQVERYLKEMGVFQLDSSNIISDPYRLLPKIELEGTILDVSNGTDAMRAYQEMLYGKNRGNLQLKNAYGERLLQYCKLDTLAMVIIWEHWLGLLNISDPTAS